MGAGSTEREKGISVVAPQPVTEGPWAVSQLCDGRRASGVVFFCAPGFSSAENLSTRAENWWWYPISFQMGYSEDKDAFSAVRDAAGSHVQEPGLLSYCEVLLLSVDLVSLYSSGSLGTVGRQQRLALFVTAPDLLNEFEQLGLALPFFLPCFSCFGYSG